MTTMTTTETSSSKAADEAWRRQGTSLKKTTRSSSPEREQQSEKVDAIDVVFDEKYVVDDRCLALSNTAKKYIFSKNFFRKILQYRENVALARGGAFEHFRAATSHVALFTPRF